ncbi:hypothetical protein FKE98_05810 [Corynebacterium aurimucosum]|uniref:hypothetical protein n=1 Tax=Corynebacterium TaxID=1716 RepID=UPI0008A2DD6F|nr:MULTISPECIES: hypothetical protein [Corynebacterium]MCG7262000.1 hypothetical protein [Corynebacterium aurimucosum]MDK6807049.1 hypothetical protein [Corynebacterium aurimucosum]MTE09963.1 hypothetical protein [Corynebacterium guaraldiae]NJJ82888.1 hypothetical protein [Corynebacterium aurimucosum]OFK29971.1 hypothetical protein HMPREF2822_00230 [Corynebacterium sp. HMSC062E11]
MRNTLIYSCIGVLAAVPLADALLPDPTPDTTPVRGIPGLECPEDPYASSQTWNCGSATIISEEGRSSREVETYLPRQHRSFNGTSALTDAPITTQAAELYRIEDGDGITLSQRHNNTISFLHIYGPKARDFADRVQPEDA